MREMLVPSRAVQAEGDSPQFCCPARGAVHIRVYVHICQHNGRRVWGTGCGEWTAVDTQLAAVVTAVDGQPMPVRWPTAVARWPALCGGPRVPEASVFLRWP